MTAIAADRPTKRRSRGVPVRKMAAVKVYAGTIVALNASGYLTSGVVATTLVDPGVAAETVDNSGGAAGDLSCRTEKGIWQFANSASTDLIGITEIGKTCYIVDNQTVAKTDGGGTRSIAGKVYDVDAQGVWVDFG
ncbi:hypothetical protein [Sphingobium yanoikuyae]|uniref:DUF2190 family protein n=1 Tax=Sphingobium yanoikuyae TaxID=13690 RepID=A0A430BX68_SPHYA|nr:hypothetical protein [Sphingobium yanoikuyae]RSU57200.1 hypothetical protein DAH51_10330 [Sphingobium yanoikuyae]